MFLEEKDNFDWTAYLLEGEELFKGPYLDTPVSITLLPG